MKLLNFFIILSITNSFSFVKCNQSNSSYMRLEPEIVLSDKDSFSKTLIAKNAVVVSANNYATEMAWQILKKGGNAARFSVSRSAYFGELLNKSGKIRFMFFQCFKEAIISCGIQYLFREK